MQIGMEPLVIDWANYTNTKFQQLSLSKTAILNILNRRCSLGVEVHL